MHLLSTSTLGAVLFAAGSANADFEWAGWDATKPAAAVPQVVTGQNGVSFYTWSAPSSWWPAKTTNTNVNGWGRDSGFPAATSSVNNGRAVGQKDCPQGQAAWRVGCREIPVCTTGRVWKGWNQGCCDEACPSGLVYDYRIGGCGNKPACVQGQVWKGWARGCCANDVNDKPNQVCPSGQYWDAAYNQCCDQKTRSPAGDKACPGGQYWDAAYNQCCDVKTRSPATWANNIGAIGHEVEIVTPADDSAIVESQ